MRLALLLLVSILLLFLRVLTICVVPIRIAYVYTPTRFLGSPVINDPHLDEIRDDIVVKLRNSDGYKAEARLIEYFIKCLAVTQPGDNPTHFVCLCPLQASRGGISCMGGGSTLEGFEESYQDCCTIKVLTL